MTIIIAYFLTLIDTNFFISDLFAGSSYAAGYYVYLWAEVLDADGFDAFLEAGGPFHAETAAKVRKFIYSSGNSLDPAEAFRKFRGRYVSLLLLFSCIHIYAYISSIFT